jgi:hypothetical protein
MNADLFTEPPRDPYDCTQIDLAVFLIEGSQQTNASLPVPKENAQGVSRLIVAVRQREPDVARRWTPTNLRSEPLEAGA